MAVLTAIESFEFRGVDSRSNPLNMPPGSALRCRNYVVKDSGSLELRNGFTTVTMSGSTSTASLNVVIPYTLFDSNGNETPYVVLSQSTQLRAMNISTGAVTSPTIRGASLTSTASFCWYLSNGKVHMGNGADQKWFDGTTFRQNGLRALTSTEVASVVLAFGVGELNSTQMAAISAVGTGSTGTFSATVGGGLLFYVSQFDTLTNELGPATNNAGSGRVTVAATNKVAITGLPNVSSSSPAFTLRKLISRTGDSLAAAYFCTNTSTAITSCTRSGTTLTVVATAHGLSSNDVVVLSGTTNFDSVYAVTVIDVNTFTVTLFLAVGQNTTGANTGAVGTCKRVVSVDASTTSVDVTSPAQDTTILANDANRGVAATSTSFTAPGYQLYGSIYNPNGGTHVGNRLAIGGGRFTLASTAATRVNVRITGLPDLSPTDSEWSIIIGRTGDGGQVPYPSTDSQGNFFFTASGQTAITLTTQGALFGTGEMPTRNGVIPAGLNMFARIGDRIHGGQTGRPYVYRSASETDATNGDFVGRPEQSWAPTDIDTFPTAEGLTGMFDEERGAFFATKNDGAVFADLGQGWAWIGPWYGAGMAGRFAWCETPYGKYWVTGHKQLATMRNGVPVIVSSEYETALLAKIGDAFLSQVQMFHLLDVVNGINKITIKCLDSSGNPYEVFHDFRLRDGRSPEGQAYEGTYSSPLSTNFIMSRVRDANGRMRLWAGASTGQLYQLEDGGNDAGTEFAADAVYLVNGGPNKTMLPEVQWFGDQNVIYSEGQTLDSTLDASASTDLEQITPASGSAEVLPGYERDFHYRAQRAHGGFPIDHLYMRFQLTSHSADGNLNLGTVPHIPLENYGRIYLVRGLAGNSLGPR